MESTKQPLWLYADLQKNFCRQSLWNFLYLSIKFSPGSPALINIIREPENLSSMCQTFQYKEGIWGYKAGALMSHSCQLSQQYPSVSF